MKRSVLIFAVCFAVAALLSAEAWAKKPDHAGGGSGKGKKEAALVEDKMGAVSDLLFGHAKREDVRGFLVKDRGRKCPPGLAKKHNGCLPPGQAKKYRIGGMLPAGHRAPPRGLLELLGAAPAGSFYTMVDDDVVLANEATRTIIDAVSILAGN